LLRNDCILLGGLVTLNGVVSIYRYRWYSQRGGKPKKLAK